MGLLDALFSNDISGGLLGPPSSWQYPTSAPDADAEKKKQDAAFLSAIAQDPYQGVSNSSAQPFFQPGTNFPNSAPALAGTNGGMLGGSTPFGLGGINLPPPSQGAPASGSFPAVPFTPPQAPSAPPPAPIQPQASPAPISAPPQAAPPAPIPQAAPTDVSAQSRAPEPGIGGGDRLMAGVQNFANARGLLPALAGGIGGLISGQRTDPQGMQQQALSATYRALVDAGVPRNTAMAAAMNPKVLEQIAPAYFGKNELVDGGTDPLTGQKRFLWKNSAEETLRPANASGGSGAPSGDMQTVTDRIADMQAKGATREQLLNEVPAGYRPYVQALLAGKAIPNNIGRSQARGSLMTLAHAVDGNFDEDKIPLRMKTETDYAPNGQSGRSIVALNTVQHHIGKLSDDLENLGDTGFTPLNAVRNSIAVNTPFAPKQGVAVQAVQDDIKAVTDEMSAAYKAGKVSDHEIEAWNKLANSNMPLRQLKQGIYDFVGLLNGKRDQLNETHTSIIGTDAPGINRELNSAITQKVTARNAGQSTSGNLPSGWSVKVR